MNRLIRAWATGVLFAILPLAQASAETDVASDTIFANGFAQYTLTIDNYLAWCSVSVNGGVASTAAQITMLLPDSTAAFLQGDRASATFVWGYWTGTDAGGNDHNQTATVTMSSDKNVLACCPFASDPGGTCP